MTGLRRAMLGIAVFQGLSTLLGAVLFLFKPHYFAFLLDGTTFAGQYLLAALLLGVVVGGTQWAAIWIHVRAPQWMAAGYAVAGFVMLGWILGGMPRHRRFYLAPCLLGWCGCPAGAVAYCISRVVPRSSRTGLSSY